MNEIKSIIYTIREFNAARDWGKYHTPKNLAASIAIESAELMELFQWTNPSSKDVSSNSKLMSNIEDEIADIIIYCISLARSLDIKLFEAIVKKMDKNNLRFPPIREI